MTVTDIWEPGAGGPRRDAIHRTFVATGASYAEGSWQRVSGLLDDYVRRWLRGYRQRCEAADARAGRPAEAQAARRTCLEERRDALRALTDVFMHADGAVVVQAVNAVQELPSIEQCDVLAKQTGASPAALGPGATREGCLAARRARRGEGAERYRAVSDCVASGRDAD